MLARVLIIHGRNDDDRLYLREYLESSSCQVTLCHASGFDLFEMVSKKGALSYDSVLLLLGEDFSEVACSSYVKALSTSPLWISCFVVAKRGSHDLLGSVRYLQAGASDVLMRPIHMEALVARIFNEVRRQNYESSLETEREESQSVEESVFLDKNSLNVDMDGERVALSRMEYRMMDIFIRHAGQILDKNTLLQQLYHHPVPPDCRIIDVYVCRLRKKLASHGHGDMIQTVWGRGYCFAPVHH